MADFNDPFFTGAAVPKPKDKKKVVQAQTKRKKFDSNKRSKKEDLDNVGSYADVEDMDLTHESAPPVEEDLETAAQKRLRIAKEYLKDLNTAKPVDIHEFDAAEIDEDLISSRLRDDVLELKGKLFHQIAEKFVGDFSGSIREFTTKGAHRLSLTCITSSGGFCGVSQADRPLNEVLYIYSAAKDGHIIKWNFITGKIIHIFKSGLKPTKKRLKAFGEPKLKQFLGHNDQIMALAASYDGKFLASGSKDKSIQIWSIPDNKHLSSFRKHRDTVSGLAFRNISGGGSRFANQLYSCSYDRTIKVWNVDEFSYMETLFGHQDQIQSIDTLVQERCVTAGSRDRTVRLWKIMDESQLIFRGGGGASSGITATEIIEGSVLATEVDQVKKERAAVTPNVYGDSIDVVAMVDEDVFLCGTDAGSISLWNIARKKPVFTEYNAHGKAIPAASSGSNLGPSCNWITALKTVPFSDLFASGSCSGFIKLWKISEDKKSFSSISNIPMIGFINSLHFFQERCSEEDEKTRGKSRLHLAVAIGQEHRLGRWWRVKEAENQVCVVSLGMM